MAPRSRLEAPSSNSETSVTRMETNHRRSLQPCCVERETAIPGCSCPQYPAVKAKSWLCPRREASYTLARILQGLDLQRKGPGDETMAWPRLSLP